MQLRMTGGKNKRSHLESLLPQSRRSERVRKKWQRSVSQQILGGRTEVGRRKRLYQFSGYPKLPSPMNGDLETLLETTGLRKFYSCLDWDCPSQNSVKDFILNSRVVNNGELCEITYCPLKCQYPVVITSEKLARAFHLSLEGIFEPSNKAAALNDAKAETRFKIDSAKKYFSLASAETRSLFIAGKFASQALFLQQSRSNLSLHNMTFFRAALNGKPVAWGQVLWRNLVRRVLSFSQQLASGSGNNTRLSHRVANIPYAAVVVALLLRVYHAPELEPSFQSLRSLQPKGSDSDESDRELLIDHVANNKRKKAKLIKEETGTEVDPLGFAIFDSRLVAGDVHDQMMTSKEDLRLPLLKMENVQSITTNLVDVFEKGEEEVSIGESETDDAAPDKTQRKLENVSNCEVCMQANTSDITTERGNSAGFCQNPPNDSCRGLEQRPVDDVHQLSSGNDSPHAPHLSERFDVQMDWTEDDVDLAVGIDDQFPEAEAALSWHSKPKLEGATAEPEEGACAVDLMDDVLSVTPEEKHKLLLEMVNDANQMPIHAPNDTRLSTEIVCKVMEVESGWKKLKPEFVTKPGEGGQQVTHKPEGQLIRHSPISPRAALGTPPRLMTEIAQVAASPLVKMAHIVKHFNQGLDAAGVPPNVYLKLKAEKLMDALKFELDNRGLQEFSEETEFFVMNWSMDKIFDAHWSLQDRLRKSQIESLKLKQEVDEIFTWFSLNKQFVSLKATNLIPEMLLVSNQVAEGERKVPLFEGLKILKDKVKDVKERIRRIELVQQRHRKEWLKQRSVLVQRWNDVKFQYSKELHQIEGLEAKVKRLEDELEEYGDKLQRESIQRSYHEVTIANLRDEIQWLKGALTAKTDEIRHTLKERDEGVKAAMLIKEEFARGVEEMQRKDIDLINAMTKICDLKQTAETMSDRLKAQDGILNDKNDEVRFLKEETARWIAESSALKLEKETISRGRRRAELQRMNQVCVNHEMEESIKELKSKIDISNDRVRKSDQMLDVKDQEINLLKVTAETADKKMQECKRTRDMALDMVQKQRGIQDANKRHMASLKEEHEKIESKLDKVLKRESRLLKELEEEKERLDEGLLDQEEQDIWSIEEETENQTAADMRGQLAMLRVEKKELFASASQRLEKITESCKVVMRSCAERPSASSAD